ncbi:MAG: phosphatidate cytidylyltransferase [Elusimicrobia bacterium]|nr:phosphatidate cytidylyltransferase [Elusimicrobiota bacterium]
MLLPRVLTGIVGIPLLLLLIHWGGMAFALFTAGIAALALYEYGMILGLGGLRTQRWGAVVWGAALALGVAFDGPVPLLLTAAVAAMVGREMFRSQRSLEGLALSLFGVVFLGLTLAHLPLIRDLRPDGEKLTFALFAAVWVMDTAAYAVGKTLGSRKLAETLSPKKTWEGAAAGFAASVLVVLLFRAALFPSGMSAAGALGLGAVIGVCGQLSDLAESMVKRAVGAKDSGALLPGHGGIMDRFDSFILAAPAVYYYMVFFS